MVRQTQGELMTRFSISDLYVVHSMQHPPEVIHKIVQLLLLLLGRSDGLSWSTIREGMRNNIKLIFKALIQLPFRLELVKSKMVWRRVKDFVKDPTNHPILVKRASQEAGNLCSWLHAIDAYRKMCTVIKKETGIARIRNYSSVSALSIRRNNKAKKLSTISFAVALAKKGKNKSIKMKKRKVIISPSQTEADSTVLDEWIQQFALPVLDRSMKAVSHISKESISELSSYRIPPLIIRQVVTAALIILGDSRDGKIKWIVARKIVSDPDFISRLKSLDRNGIPSRRIRVFEKYVETYGLDSSFVKNASQAAWPILTWAEGMRDASKIHKSFLKMVRKSAVAKA